ncbi:MAG: hypothetical protein KIT84_42150 [Labilithrix sp.]|nr:hypothetical protein [Labilithrix sp.]MCW5817678.1 hypothetical protein [Labilithrix sp.]
MDGEVMQRVAAMRAAIAKLRTELDALTEAEEQLSEKLRSLGIDDAITTVDLPTVAGLPSRRKKRAAVGAGGELSTIKAAAAGAGLMLGVALVVLLALNLVTRRSEPAPIASASASASVAPPAASVVPVAAATTPSAEPAPSAAPPPSASAEAPPKPEMGAITVLCTPRCDWITDNGAPLSPGNLVGVPVPVGPHRIEARANGVKRSYSVNVAPNQTREVRINLEPVDRGF